MTDTEEQQEDSETVEACRLVYTVEGKQMWLPEDLYQQLFREVK